MNVKTKRKCFCEVIDVKKDVGIVKEIDKLGRIVIPKDFRDRLNLGNEVEIVITNEGILIRNIEYVLVKKEDNNK